HLYDGSGCAESHCTSRREREKGHALSPAHGRERRLRGIEAKLQQLEAVVLVVPEEVLEAPVEERHGDLRRARDAEAPRERGVAVGSTRIGAAQFSARNAFCCEGDTAGVSPAVCCNPSSIRACPSASRAGRCSRPQARSRCPGPRRRRRSQGRSTTCSSAATTSTKAPPSSRARPA